MSACQIDMLLGLTQLLQCSGTVTKDLLYNRKVIRTQEYFNSSTSRYVMIDKIYRNGLKKRGSRSISRASGNRDARSI